METPIFYVGDLRKAIEGLPDEMTVFSQAVGKDGSCWSLFTVFGDVASAKPPAVALRMSHPKLMTLHNADGKSGSCKHVRCLLCHPT